MIATEIRLGNIIGYTNSDYWISDVHGAAIVVGLDEFIAIEEEKTDEDGNELYEPIPLTEEWLLKFEWEHLDYRSKWQKHNCPFQLEEPDSEDEGYLLLFDNERLHELPSIKFVHQLQNLYYALTDTELIITNVNHG